jgi:hypothetical protein
VDVTCAGIFTEHLTRSRGIQLDLEREFGPVEIRIVFRGGPAGHRLKVDDTRVNNVTFGIHAQQKVDRPRDDGLLDRNLKRLLDLPPESHSRSKQAAGREGMPSTAT